MLSMMSIGTASGDSYLLHALVSNPNDKPQRLMAHTFLPGNTLQPNPLNP